MPTRFWDFREALEQAGAFAKLLSLLDEQLRPRGLLAQPGKLIDAGFVDGPRQRNQRDENATLKAGAVPAAWGDQPAKQRQKDVDARPAQRVELLPNEFSLGSRFRGRCDRLPAVMRDVAEHEPRPVVPVRSCVAKKHRTIRFRDRGFRPVAELRWSGKR